MNDLVILLTSTVNVSGMAFTALSDKDVRESHYIQAIDFYFNNTDLKIVIVENTGHDFFPRLDKSKANSSRLEVLSFNGNNYPKKLGKGFGELEAISYAIANSKFIGEETSIIKITGRYKVFNIDTFVQNNLSKSKGICQFLYFKGKKIAFSGVFVANKHFLKSFLEKHQYLMNDSEGIYFEHVLANSILDYMAKGGDFEMLKSYPRLLGISGTENIPHPTNKFSFWLIRNCIYKILSANYSILEKLTSRFYG